MSDVLDGELAVSELPDMDMRGVSAALMRAAKRARDIARETGTAIVIMRDGRLVEEYPEPEEPASGGS